MSSTISHQSQFSCQYGWGALNLGKTMESLTHFSNSRANSVHQWEPCHMLDYELRLFGQLVFPRSGVNSNYWTLNTNKMFQKQCKKCNSSIIQTNNCLYVSRNIFEFKRRGKKTSSLVPSSQTENLLIAVAHRCDKVCDLLSPCCQKKNFCVPLTLTAAVGDLN